MSAGLGWSELLLLGIIAGLLLDAKDLRALWKLARRAREYYYRLRYACEGALQGQGDAMPVDYRLESKVRVRGLSAEQKAQASALLVDELRSEAALKDAPCLAAFCPNADEPAIGPWLAEMAAQGRLLLPRILPDRHMEFVAVSDLEKDLVRGAFNLKEPRPDLPASPAEPTVYLVPGVAFGPRGERLGHGAGYYDRYLSAHPSALRIGLCYDVQLWNTPLPQLSHDVRMDRVLTAPAGSLTA